MLSKEELLEIISTHGETEKIDFKERIDLSLE